MVRLDRVDDLIVFPIFLGQVRADLGVGAFYLVIHRFPDVMQQSSPFGQRHVSADLRGHDPCQMGHFNGMLQYVLAIAGAVNAAAPSNLTSS